jgi:hypothetical protein
MEHPEEVAAVMVSADLLFMELKVLMEQTVYQQSAAAAEEEHLPWV